MSRKRHYGLYLYEDDPDDAIIIQFLERYAKTRRVGETLRRAVGDYMRRDGLSVQLPLERSATIMPMPAKVAVMEPATPSVDVLAKAKRAFMK